MSRYSPIYAPGITPNDRTLRWLGKKVEGGLRGLERMFTDTKGDSTTGTLSGDGCIFASIEMPSPPSSAAALVEGFLNCYLASGSAADTVVSLEAGGFVIATARCYVQSPGTCSVTLRARHVAREAQTYACRIKSVSGSTALTLYARGVVASWFTE